MIVPVKQRQQGEPVEVQADPHVGQQPQAIVLLGLADGSGGRRVLGAQRCILELGTQIPVLLLQQLRVHRQQAVQADLREGELPHSQRNGTTQSSQTAVQTGVNFTVRKPPNCFLYRH